MVAIVKNRKIVATEDIGLAIGVKESFDIRIKLPWLLEERVEHLGYIIHLCNRRLN